MTRLDRTRSELAGFLRAHRERLTPADVGLPSGKRRRTPGLRREELAALAGVGLTWYTWLEQGREIGVSAAFLDSLARVLKLDAAERRHLFLLAQARPPTEPAKTWCVIPPPVRRLMHDLVPHAAYVLNLRWDILGFNAAADTLFGFGQHTLARRNLLWLMFTDPLLRERFADWETCAAEMLAGFRRDYARATQEADIHELIAELERVSSEFKDGWRRHAVPAATDGIHALVCDGVHRRHEHTSLTIDADRHLRMMVYARVEDA